MNSANGRPRVVVLGMMSKMPVGGVIWQTLHYLVGLERLGCEVFYVEAHGTTPRVFFDSEDDDGWGKAAAFIDRVMRRIDLGGRWAFHDRFAEDRCYGLRREELVRLYRSAALIINLHGGTEPLPEHYETGRLVYLETDPVALQIELRDGDDYASRFLEPHCAFFTFGENLGAPDCPLPVDPRFPFKPTRQPVVLDLWTPAEGPGESFTTIGNWEQPHRQVSLRGETYHWSKHFEFMKFVSLPTARHESFELALSSCSDEDRMMLETRGWRVRPAIPWSLDSKAYRDYILASRGEFTVAKDQNVRLRSGWFSDRSATYLAAARPVVTQDTGFGNVLPTGAGLFPFRTEDDIGAALDLIASDYEHHRQAALDVARGWFSHDVVLSAILSDLGVSVQGGRPGRAASSLLPFPADLSIIPVSRWPTRLAPSTIVAVDASPFPSYRAPGRAAEPEVSIVVVTWNNWLFTRLCLETLLGSTIHDSFEVVIVDNGSTDGTLAHLAQLAEYDERVVVVTNATNRGFAAANNQGLAMARGRVLFLLNNDTMVTPGWLTGLLTHLQDPAVGMVGPVTNRTCNEAQVDDSYSTYGGFLDAAALRSGRFAGRTFEIPMLAMFCVGLRRDVHERLGPLDERFEVGMFEDDDYAHRARLEGLRVICAEDVLVHHFGQATVGGLVEGGTYDDLFTANRRRFEEKWDTVWQGHGRRSSPEYRDLRKRVRAVVTAIVPSGSTVLIISKGDDELLDVRERNAWHFPREADGAYAHCYPPGSEDAVDQVESARAEGAEFLAIPAPGFWWLEHYSAFAHHLHSRFEIVHSDGDVMIFDLRSPASYALQHSDSRGVVQ